MKKNYTNLEVKLMSELNACHRDSDGKLGTKLDLGGREWNAYSFRGLDLRGVSMAGAQFVNCNFAGADIRDTDRTDTTFTGCNFLNCNGVVVEQTVKFVTEPTATAAEPTTADVVAAIEAAPATEPETVTATVTEVTQPRARK